MSENNVVNITVTGKDQATPELNKAAAGGKGLIGIFGDVAKGLAVFDLAAGGFAKLSGAVETFLGRATAVGGEVKQLQREFGGSAEDASHLRFQLEQTGVAFEAGEKGLKKFGQALTGVSDLEDGVVIPTGKAMVANLHALGIEAEDAEGKQRSMTDILGDTADVFKGMPDGVGKTTLATKLFGKAGADLLPFLNKGRDGLAGLSKEADKLGLTLNQKTLDSLAKQKIAMREMNAAIDGVKVQIGVALIPLMTQAAVVGGELATALNEKLVPVIQDLAGWLGDRLAPAFEAVQGVVRTFADLIESALTGDLASAAAAFNSLPGPLQAVAIVMALVYEVALQVWEALKDLWDIGRKVVGFLDDLRGKFDAVLPGSTSFTTSLVKLGDQKGAIEGIAVAITGLFAVMAVKMMLDFAAAVANTALSFIQFPIDLVKGAAGEVAGFVKAVAGLVSKVVTTTFDVIGKGVQFLTALVTGAFQKLLDANPLHQKLNIQTTGGGAGDTAKAAGATAGGSWLSGFKDIVSPANIGNAIASALGSTPLVAGAAAGAPIAAITATMGVSLILLPIALPVAAIATAVALFKDTVLDELKDLPGQIADVLSGLPEALGEVIGRAAVIFATLPIVALMGIIKGVQLILPQIETAVSVVGGKIMDGISLGIKASIPKITAAFDVAFDPQTYVHIFEALIEQIGLTIADPTRILTGVKALGEALATGIEEAAHLAVEAFFIGIGALTTVATFVLGLVDKIFGDIFHGIVEGVRKQWEAMNELTDGALNDLKDTIAGALGFARDVAVFAMAVITGTIENAFSYVWGAAIRIWNGIETAITGPIDTIIGKIRDLIREAEKIASLGGLPGKIIGKLIDAVPHAMGGITGAGELSLVGERGPELVALPGGSRVFSNSESRQMASGGGTTIVNVYPQQIILQGDPQSSLASLGAMFA